MPIPSLYRFPCQVHGGGACARRWFAVTVLWIYVGAASASAEYFSPDPWVLINSRSRTLSIVRDGQIVLEFDNIAFGRGGTADQRVLGDGRTPLGNFRVQYINRQSPYGIFFGLNYPTPEHAQRAYRARLIDRITYLRVLYAHEDDRLPPQDTRLGGHIGIHGLGKGDPTIHRDFDWTRGCVALTNRQIRQFARWVQLGTRVLIR
jgi:murein L,D-transpeptidase YafK